MNKALRDRVGVYAGFAATGVGLALPGALMPSMLVRWGLGDARGGLLLFCLFAGTTVGALCAGGQMARSVARGAWAATVGAAWLAVAAEAVGAFAAMFVFGVGLGLTMTSIMLLQSRRFPDDRRTEMTRLNLLWAAGACTAPSLALGLGRGTVAVGRAAVVFAVMAVVFAVLGVWSWFGEAEAAEKVEAGLPTSQSRDGHPDSHWALGLLAIGWPLLVLVFCETGVESSAGGWLAAYASRESGAAHLVVGAATCYWAGLLASRLLFSTRRAERVPERALLLVNLCAMLLAFGALLLWPQGAVTLTAAAALGFAQGPVYPLLIAMVLRRREVAGIFVVAGFGSSLLPLATGALSGRMGSLRLGLGVPLVAVAVMVGLGLRRSVVERV